MSRTGPATDPAQDTLPGLASLVPSRPAISSKGNALKPVDLAVKRAKYLEFPKNIGPQFVSRHLEWFDNFYRLRGRYPSDSDIAERFGWSARQIQVLNTSKYWHRCLERRGISLPHEATGGLIDVLTERQVAALVVITNLSDPRPVEARLVGDLGITFEELDGWYKNPEFVKRLNQRAQDSFDNAAPVAKAQLAKQVNKGNFNAIKFYMEITGEANSPEVTNSRRLVQALIEAVQKNVKDPAILEAIAREVQAVSSIQTLAGDN